MATVLHGNTRINKRLVESKGGIRSAMILPPAGLKAVGGAAFHPRYKTSQKWMFGLWRDLQPGRRMDVTRTSIPATRQVGLSDSLIFHRNRIFLLSQDDDVSRYDELLFLAHKVSY